MKELNLKTPDISIFKSIKKGIKSISDNRKNLCLKLIVPTVFIALLVMITICGNIGTVKIDYNNYIPYHEISNVFIVKYIIGATVSFIFFLFWRGNTFFIMKKTNEKDGKWNIDKIRTSDYFYSGLHFIQCALLLLLTFGVIGLILIYLSITASPWIWCVTIPYLLFVSVPVYICKYEYMLSGENFRQALKKALHAVKEQWGRIFLHLLIVNTAAIILLLLINLPSLVIIMGIYDNATAVAMTGAEQTPTVIFIMEYITVFISCIFSLLIVFACTSLLKFFHIDSYKYSLYLKESRTEEM